MSAHAVTTLQSVAGAAVTTKLRLGCRIIIIIIRYNNIVIIVLALSVGGSDQSTINEIGILACFGIN